MLDVEESFFDRSAKRRAMRVANAPVVVPCVAMGVELHQRDWSQRFGHTTQLAERDRMIPADPDRNRAFGGEIGVSRLNQLVSRLDIAGNGRHIPRVDDVHAVERVDPVKLIGWAQKD